MTLFEIGCNLKLLIDLEDDTLRLFTLHLISLLIKWVLDYYSSPGLLNNLVIKYLKVIE